MEEDERTYLEKLKLLHQRRLQKLELKRAQLGISTPPEIEIEIEDIGGEVKQVDERLHRSRAFSVDLLSHVAIAPRERTTIQIDWTSHFHNSIASAETWAQQLIPDLDRVYRQVAQSSPEPAVALRQRATISAGLAFGAVFSAASRIRLWVEQHTNDRESQWWAAQEDAPTIVGLLLDEQHVTLDPQASDTLIEVGVAQDVGKTVDQWLQRQSQIFGERIRLIPNLGPGRTVVPDAAHALAMARQVGAACVTAHGQRPAGSIHLFVSAPFGLALMIGRQLNACGLVQWQAGHLKRPPCGSIDRLSPTVAA